MRPGPYKEVVSFLTLAKEADFKKYKKHLCTRQNFNSVVTR